jgi:hypothetical protein
MPSSWIFPIAKNTADTWALVKADNVYAVGRKIDRDKIHPKDRVVFYLAGTDPPVFVGAYEVAGDWKEAKQLYWPKEKAEGKVFWPWQFPLTPLRLGAVDARDLSNSLSFVPDKDKKWWHVYYSGSIGNFGRPIPEGDFQRINEELSKPPIPYQFIKRPLEQVRKPSALPKTTYFILQTGGGEYEDQPDRVYNFKKSIPGSVQLRKSENLARFVYYEDKQFYGKGEIGKIEEREKDGTTHYYAEVKNFEKIGPVLIKDVQSKLGFSAVGRQGIKQISYQQYESVLSAAVKTEIPTTLEVLREETLVSNDFLTTIGRLLEEKRQIIFYGPPGTGKTFVAKKFGQYFAGKFENLELVQFHPSYSYEDFVEGIRPKPLRNQITYSVEDGVMKALCRRALRAPDERFVLLIDEINRSNLSKILGELTHCLEYRGRHNTVTLPYSQQSFFIPENVYVIGTMNSADRSIALVDFALRRRFHFIEFLPNVDVLTRWFEKNPGNVDVQKVVALLNKMNERISGDDKLGKYFQIGHSYFMHKGFDGAKLSDVWTYDIVPMLE